MKLSNLRRYESIRFLRLCKKYCDSNFNSIREFAKVIGLAHNTVYLIRKRLISIGLDVLDVQPRVNVSIKRGPWMRLLNDRIWRKHTFAMFLPQNKIGRAKKLLKMGRIKEYNQLIEQVKMRVPHIQCPPTIKENKTTSSTGPTITTVPSPITDQQPHYKVLGRYTSGRQRDLVGTYASLAAQILDTVNHGRKTLGINPIHATYHTLQPIAIALKAGYSLEDLMRTTRKKISEAKAKRSCRFYLNPWIVSNPLCIQQTLQYLDSLPEQWLMSIPSKPKYKPKPNFAYKKFDPTIGRPQPPLYKPKFHTEQEWEVSCEIAKEGLKALKEAIFATEHAPIILSTKPSEVSARPKGIDIGRISLYTIKQKLRPPLYDEDQSPEAVARRFAQKLEEFNQKFSIQEK